MERFGVMSPTYGIRQDTPSVLLPAAFTPDNENVLLQHGEVHRAKMRQKELLNSSSVQQQTPDEKRILKYHWHTVESTGYLLAFTTNNIYRWQTDTLTWSDSMFECSSAITTWQVASYGSHVVAVNNIDKVIWWDSTGVGFPGTSFVALDNATYGLEYTTGKYVTTAKIVVMFENYIIIGGTTEDGDYCPRRIRWCNYEDIEDWEGGDAGYIDLDNVEEVVQFEKWQGQLLVFATNCIKRGWLVTGTDVFIWTDAFTSIGCESPNSIIKTKTGKVCFYATDKTFREISDGEISKAIDKTVKKFSTSMAYDICSAYIIEYGEIWWAVPSSSGSTQNDYVVCYNVENKKWSFRDLSVSAFGRYDRTTSYTIDTIPFDTIDEIGWDTIDSPNLDSEFLVDLCADYDGYSYASHESQSDAGSDYTGYFVIKTDFASKKALFWHKRLLEITVITRPYDGGELSLYVKEDNEADWELAGTIELAGESGNEEFILETIPVDFRARVFDVRTQGGNRFDVVGLIFGFENDPEE